MYVTVVAVSPCIYLSFLPSALSTSPNSFAPSLLTLFLLQATLLLSRYLGGGGLSLPLCSLSSSSLSIHSCFPLSCFLITRSVPPPDRCCFLFCDFFFVCPFSPPPPAPFLLQTALLLCQLCSFSYSLSSSSPPPPQFLIPIQAAETPFILSCFVFHRSLASLRSQLPPTSPSRCHHMCLFWRAPAL